MFGEFNDPFEFVPGNFGESLSSAEVEEFYSHSMHDPANYYDYFMDAQCGVRATVGVICFTSKKDNLLMWAHYANNHAGVCVEFDATAKFFNGQYKNSSRGLFRDGTKADLYENLGEVKKVRYSKKRPLFIDPNEISYDTDFWFTKSDEWSYEDEYRIFLPVEHAINKDDFRFYRLDKSIIKSVILGCQMAKKTKDEIYSICSPLGIHVRESFVNSAEFKLDIVDFHPDNQEKYINVYNLAKITKW